jgi:cytochrome bd-type quinol oxidase subunit 2
MENNPSKTKGGVEGWLKVVCLVLCVKTKREMEMRLLTLVKMSVVPCLFFMEMAVYWYYFYLRGKTYTDECCVNAVICVMLSALIVWCHYHACQDPGYVYSLPN